MAENLRYLPYVNPATKKRGAIPGIFVYGYSGQEVSKAIESENYDTYGALYSYNAAMTACPDGWRLPTDAEWQAVESSLGMLNTPPIETGWRFDGEVGEALKMEFGWIWGDGNVAYVKGLTYYDQSVYRGTRGLTSGISVRCVKK